MRLIRAVPLLVATAAGIAATFIAPREAHAIPSFARKYQTSCVTCHTVYPVLNPFGEAFRRDGYRFPSDKGSVDSELIRASEIALGQDEGGARGLGGEQLAPGKTFPDTVWPDKIVQAVPLSVAVK